MRLSRLLFPRRRKRGHAKQSRRANPIFPKHRKIIFEPLEPCLLLSADPTHLTLSILDSSTSPQASALVQPLANSSSQPPILDSGRVSGAISVPGEQDRYTFTLAQEAHLYFDALTNNSNVTWTLEGSPGTVVNARAFTGTDAFDAPGGNPA